jgi:hypothetical protein
MLRHVIRAFAAAGMLMVPGGSEANLRIVAAESLMRGVRQAQGKLGPKRLGGSDDLALEAAEAKRARKAAKRLARSH